MTQYVTLCMTQNVGAIFWQKMVYDTKVYDTKCTTFGTLVDIFTVVNKTPLQKFFFFKKGKLNLFVFQEEWTQIPSSQNLLLESNFLNLSESHGVSFYKGV